MEKVILPVNCERLPPNEFRTGASIIRMLNKFLGDKTFQQGLSNYLKTR